MANESAAFFLDACVRLGVGDLHQKMLGFGWTSLGAYAFSSSYNPAQASDEPFMTGVVDRLGLDRGHPRVTRLRRLFFEAYTFEAADMRRQLGFLCQLILQEVK